MCEDKRRILLVEGDASIAATLKSGLEGKGYHVHLAITGEEAVRTVVQDAVSFDLLLIDINSGIGVAGPGAAELVLRHEDMPVVFLFSPSEPEVLQRTESIISYGYVAKNSDIRVIDASLRVALRLFDAGADRARAEKALEESERTYREIFNSINDAIWVHEVETGRFVDANAKVTEMFGYSIEEVLNLDLDDISSGHPPFNKEQAAIYLNRALQGEILVFEWQCRHKSGSLFWTEVSLRKATINGVERIVAIERDITRRKHAEEEQKRLAEQLHQSHKMDALGQLAGGVAHDFNNLLSGIIGATEVLLLADNTTEATKSYLSLILTAAERAANLTKKLLAFSRRGTKASTAVDCKKILADTIEILQRTIDRNITISLVNKAAHTSIVGDDSLLQNALMNMGINASQAMPQGGTLTFLLENIYLDAAYCKASPFDIKPGDYLSISVRDTGCGMSPEVASRVFEPFFTTKEPGKGTGLGLAMVYGTVQEHGGAVTVYSVEGSGTVFHIYFPLQENAVPREPLNEPMPRGTGTILLIDDEELIRITATSMLESLGYTVILAVNGEEGVKTFAEKSQEIDLVVLDMIMPVLGGRETFRKLREIDQGVPVLMASGFADEQHVEVLKEQGLSGFLQKPFRLSELAAKVHKALST